MKKRGVAVWLSWILLMSFVIIIGVLMQDWLLSYTRGSAEDIQRRSYNTAECDYVSISINKACQDTQTLYINATNNKNLEITGVIVQFFTIYGETQVREANVTLRPERANSFTMLKQGVIRQIAVVPTIVRSNTLVVCSNQKAELTTVDFC